MDERKRIIISMVIKLIIIVCFITGFSLSFLYGHVNGVTNLLYFTQQSNLWIALMDLVMVVFIIRALVRKEYKLPSILYRLLQVFTLCITITGLVYCFILIPGFYLSDVVKPDGYTPFNTAAVLLHMVIPTLAVIDFLMFTRNVEFKKYDFLLALAPSAYYFIFSLIGFLLNWDFGDGRNYPYFFINYASPAGIFGFSSEMPYFMGSFYWIVILSGMIVGLSYLYIWLIRKIMAKANKAA